MPATKNFDMEVVSEEEARSKIISFGGRGRTSQYEPVAEQWVDTDDDEAIVMDGLEKNDIQNLRNLLYRRFGKENVIVRSAKQDDDSTEGEEAVYKAVIRSREDNEYLRNGN